MFGRRTAIAIVLLMAVLPCHVHGWSEAGHRIITSIAFRQLTPAAQHKLVSWLRCHPRYAEDFAKQMPAEMASANEEARNEWLLQQASLWPDVVRGFPDDLKEVYHHSTWHYITHPSYLTTSDRSTLEKTLSVNNRLDTPSVARADMNAIQLIRHARRNIPAARTSARQKAILLCWLLHVAGDIHQPLHSTSMYSVKLFPEGDKGGNSIPTLDKFNLHAVWDQFPGFREPFATARSRASAIMGNAAQVQLGRNTAKQCDERQWLAESRHLALVAVYDPEVLGYLRVQATSEILETLPPLKLSDEYLQRGKEISSRRIVEAGYRLGAVLQEIIANEQGVEPCACRPRWARKAKWGHISFVRRRVFFRFAR